MSLTSRAVAALAIGSVGLALTACGADSSSDTTASGSSASAATEIRLGYFPNVTHAVPIVGDKEGTFAKALGSTKLKVSTFNAGPAVGPRQRRRQIDHARPFARMPIAATGRPFRVRALEPQTLQLDVDHIARHLPPGMASQQIKVDVGLAENSRQRDTRIFGIQGDRSTCLGKLS